MIWRRGRAARGGGAGVYRSARDMGSSNFQVPTNDAMAAVAGARRPPTAHAAAGCAAACIHARALLPCCGAFACSLASLPCQLHCAIVLRVLPWRTWQRRQRRASSPSWAPRRSACSFGARTIAASGKLSWVLPSLARQARASAAFAAARAMRCTPQAARQQSSATTVQPCKLPATPHPARPCPFTPIARLLERRRSELEAVL
jgi:hypothetical protein